MAKGLYIGNESSVSKKQKKLYVGVNGIARKIKKIYIGNSDGKAKSAYSGQVQLSLSGTQSVRIPLSETSSSGYYSDRIANIGKVGNYALILGGRQNYSFSMGMGNMGSYRKNYNTFESINESLTSSVCGTINCGSNCACETFGDYCIVAGGDSVSATSYSNGSSVSFTNYYDSHNYVYSINSSLTVNNFANMYCCKGNILSCSLGSKVILAFGISYSNSNNGDGSVSTSTSFRGNIETINQSLTLSQAGSVSSRNSGGEKAFIAGNYGIFLHNTTSYTINSSLTTSTISHTSMYAGTASIDDKYGIVAGGDPSSIYHYGSAVYSFNSSLVKTQLTGLSQNVQHLIGISDKDFAMFTGGNIQYDPYYGNYVTVYDSSLTRVISQTSTVAYSSVGNARNNSCRLGDYSIAGNRNNNIIFYKIVKL